MLLIKITLEPWWPLNYRVTSVVLASYCWSLQTDPLFCPPYIYQIFQFFPGFILLGRVQICLSWIYSIRMNSCVASTVMGLLKMRMKGHSRLTLEDADCFWRMQLLFWFALNTVLRSYDDFALACLLEFCVLFIISWCDSASKKSYLVGLPRIWGSQYLLKFSLSKIGFSC